MASYQLSEEAKADLIRIHQYGIIRFGEKQADFYFATFFNYFDEIAKRPFSFEAIDHIKINYRKCVCGSDTIYFKVSPQSTVQIMAIVGRQDLNTIFK